MFDALWVAAVLMVESGTGEFSVQQLASDMGVSRVAGNKWVKRMQQIDLVKKTRYGRYAINQDSIFVRDLMSALGI